MSTEGYCSYCVLWRHCSSESSLGFPKALLEMVRTAESKVLPKAGTLKSLPSLSCTVFPTLYQNMLTGDVCCRSKHQ